MKRHGFLLFLTMLVMGGFLFGCMGPTAILPNETPVTTEPTNYSLYGVANYIPGQLEEDPYPLFVGARWLYRNAAKYWNPQISASGLLESEIVAVVQGDGMECYVLQTHYSNGPDQLLYLHRTENRVALRGSRTVEASGAQTSFSLNPGLAFLRLPLVEDAFWPLETKEGVGEAYVYHQEVVAIESGEVRTLLGSHSPIFLGSWRVHYELPESSPRLYGGPVQFLWFAPGVGVVKHVLNSVDYELAEFRLQDEIVLLEEQDAGKIARVPAAGLAIVQLRGGSPSSVDGWEWVVANELGEDLAVEQIGSGFYDDTPRVAKTTEAGTYVFQFRALQTGADVTLRFELRNVVTGMSGRVLEYTIRVD